MVKLELFEVDHWILTHTTNLKHNLAHSYCLPISINTLGLPFQDAHASSDPVSSVLSTPMGYGSSMKGSEELRVKIAHMYPDNSSGHLSPENILTTPGASLANFLVIFALLGPGDHAIVQYPTYQQLYALPRSVGAEVSLWKAKENNGWNLDTHELKGLIKPNTKMIVLNTPQNPTGAVIPKTTLEEIVKIAREHSISILSDEIYRPLFHSISPTDPDFPPSILSLGYENAIATSSLSKVYSLAGLRVGWIASNSSSIVDLCINARSYALISMSHIDEHVASFALGPACVDNLLERNTTLVKRNLALVESFIEEHSSICEWVEPAGAPIGFVKFTRSGEPVDDFELCRSLLEKKGLLLVPGSKCFGDGKHFRGYVRIGFGGDTAELRAGLKALGEAIKDNYSALPLL